MGVPLVVHQIWFDLGKGPKPIGSYAEACATWPRHNPGLTFKLWGQAEVEQLIRSQYSWFWPTWCSLAEPIHKIDAARPIILHAVGGMYVDADISCTRSIRNLFDYDGVSLWESPFGVTLGNSFQMGPAGHPFWLTYLRLIQRRVQKWCWTAKDSWFTTMVQSGPAALHGAWIRYCRRHGEGWCRIFGNAQLFPMADKWMPQAYGRDALAEGWAPGPAKNLDVLRILLLIGAIVGLVALVRWSRR